MSRDDTKAAGFMLRMLSLVAFSCMILFAGVVIIQNEELGKLIPPSIARTLTILFAYLVAMITFNYALAMKGRNFMGWKNEMLIMIGFILVFLGMFLPHAFPTSEVKVTEGWFSFFSKESTQLKANWFFAVISLLALPFFFKAWKGIRAMPLWQLTDTEK